MSLDDVVAEVERFGCELVEMTGGEPLLQKEVYPLMQRLLDGGRTVMVETGGHRSIADVPAPVIRIVDVKCPGSGESERNHWANLALLTARDEVKFVIRDRVDYEFARRVTAEHDLVARTAAVLFSPVHAVLDGERSWPRGSSRTGWSCASSCRCTSSSGARTSAASDMTRRAVLLLSGGLDSYTAGAEARADGYELYALTILYGQVHAREVAASRDVARDLGVVRHLELAVDLASFRRLLARRRWGRFPRTGSSTEPTFRRPTFRRATRSSSRWRWAGRKCWVLRRSSSA